MKTKLTLLLLIAISSLLNFGCLKVFEETVVEKSKLNFRNYKCYPVNSDTPYSGRIVTFYGNGQLQKNESYKDGLSQFYYDNGQLWFSRNYKDGEIDGLSGRYEENPLKCFPYPYDYDYKQKNIIEDNKNENKYKEENSKVNEPNKTESNLSEWKWLYVDEASHKLLHELRAATSDHTIQLISPDGAYFFW